MDRNQLLNDAEAAQVYALDGRQAKMWTAMPGIVQAVNNTQMTVQVQPAIQGVYTNAEGDESYINLPLLVDVPICFPSAGGFTISFPMKKGDEVLIILASRCIDAWWQNGGVGVPMEMRMHDLSDGFALPGPRSLPRVIAGISSTDLQIRNDAGTTFLSITAGGLIGMQNSTTSLKTTLTNLQTLLNTFMSALAALPSSPVSGTALSVPAATAVTALGNVLTEIGALLQ